jgi:lipid-A-disaccharide synthase-like uncharacterized protein
MDCVSVVKSLYFIIFSVSFFITFLSSEIATSHRVRVSFSLSRIVMSSLLLVWLVLSICAC